MSATQLPLFGQAEPPPVDEAWRRYLAAWEAHKPLCRDPRCLTDEEHWAATGRAQREVEVAYNAWVKAGGR